MDCTPHSHCTLQATLQSFISEFRNEFAIHSGVCRRSSDGGPKLAQNELISKAHYESTSGLSPLFWPERHLTASSVGSWNSSKEPKLCQNKICSKLTAPAVA